MSFCIDQTTVIRILYNVPLFDIKVSRNVPNVDKKNAEDCVITVFLPPEDVGDVYKDTVERMPISDSSSTMVSCNPDPELDPWILPEISLDENKKCWKGTENEYFHFSYTETIA